MNGWFWNKDIMGCDNNKKSPARDAGQRRASSIHERLPDKPASTWIPVSRSIDHYLSSSSWAPHCLKTFFHITSVFILRPLAMRVSAVLKVSLKSAYSCNTMGAEHPLPASKR